MVLCKSGAMYVSMLAAVMFSRGSILFLGEKTWGWIDWSDRLGILLLVDIAVVATPAENTPAVVKQVVRAGIKAILNFAPVQLSVPADVTVRNVNMAMELEGLSYALTNRD